MRTSTVPAATASVAMVVCFCVIQTERGEPTMRTKWIPGVFRDKRKNVNDKSPQNTRRLQGEPGLGGPPEPRPTRDGERWAQGKPNPHTAGNRWPHRRTHPYAGWGTPIPASIRSPQAGAASA